MTRWPFAQRTLRLSDAPSFTSHGMDASTYGTCFVFDWLKSKLSVIAGRPSTLPTATDPSPVFFSNFHAAPPSKIGSGRGLSSRFSSRGGSPLRPSG